MPTNSRSVDPPVELSEMVPSLTNPFSKRQSLPLAEKILDPLVRRTLSSVAPTELWLVRISPVPTVVRSPPTILVAELRRRNSDPFRASMVVLLVKVPALKVMPPLPSARSTLLFTKPGVPGSSASAILPCCRIIPLLMIPPELTPICPAPRKT